MFALVSPTTINQIIKDFLCNSNSYNHMIVIKHFKLVAYEMRDVSNSIHMHTCFSMDKNVCVLLMGIKLHLSSTMIIFSLYLYFSLIIA